MSGESPQDGTVARHEAHLLHKHESNGMLPAAREEQRINCKDTPTRLSGDFSAETLQDGREWQIILKVLKGKYMKSRILYPTRLFGIGREIKNFSDKQKLKDTAILNLAYKKNLNDIFK